MAKKTQTNRQPKSTPEQTPDNPMQAFMRLIWSSNRPFRIIALFTIFVIGVLFLIWNSFPESSKEEVITYARNIIRQEPVKKDSIHTPEGIKEKFVTVDLISTQVGKTKIGGPEESQKQIENIITNKIRERLKICFSDSIKKGFNVNVTVFVNSEKDGYPQTVYPEVDQKDVDARYINCLRDVFKRTLFPEPEGYDYEVKFKVRVVPWN